MNDSFYGLNPTTVLLPNPTIIKKVPLGADIYYQETGCVPQYIGRCSGQRIDNWAVDTVPDVSIDINPCSTSEVGKKPFVPMPGYVSIGRNNGKALWLDEWLGRANGVYGGLYGGIVKMKIKNVKFKEMAGWLRQAYAIKVTWAYSENTTEIQVHRDDIYYSREELLMQCFALYKLGIKKLIFSGPATIAIWNDNKKTMVKCKEDEEAFNAENGLYLCVMKKFLDDSSIRHCFKKWIKE